METKTTKINKKDEFVVTSADYKINLLKDEIEGLERQIANNYTKIEELKKDAKCTKLLLAVAFLIFVVVNLYIVGGIVC